MTEWLLDYDGAALTLRVPEGAAETLPYSAFYKLSLRRYIAKQEGVLFTGKPALTHLDFQRVIALCEKECARQGGALTVSPALAEYIQGRGNYLAQRFRLGVEIKNREEKLLPRFREYQSIVNAAMALAAQSVYLTALTGTPVPNSYLDLFPNEYDEFFGFSDVLLRHPTPAEMETVNKRLQPFFCRTTKEHLEVPPALPDRILTCPASVEENRLLDLLVQKCRGNKLALFLQILQLESNPRLCSKSWISGISSTCWTAAARRSGG